MTLNDERQPKNDPIGIINLRHSFYNTEQKNLTSFVNRPKSIHKKNDKWQMELLFGLVIVTVSQFNTKLSALELIGNRDFFPQSMPVPNE